MMKRSLITIFLGLFFLFLASFLFCSEFKTVPSHEKTGKFIMAPLLFYTPETRTGGGAVLNYTYWTNLSESPSNLSVLFIYTQNRQFNIEIKADNIWSQGTIFSNVDLIFGKYPDKFYGIGNNTQRKDEENYIHTYANAKIILQRKMVQNFFMGIGYEFEYSENSDFKTGGLLEGGEITGSRGGIDSSIGIIANYDSRDSRFYPLSGGRYVFTSFFFNGLIGSDYDFNRYTLDLRRYFSPLLNHVLAFQFYLNCMTGEVPFQMLSLFGGRYLMRGYFLGRYRDKTLIALQAEYRMPLIWRFGFVGFGGIGDVAAKLNDFEISQFKYSAGLGLRILMNSQDKINLRLDYAFGKESRGFYISLFEAF